MKKFVTLGLVAVLGVALATGCKKKEETTTETTTTTESQQPAVVQETGTTATTTTMGTGTEMMATTPGAATTTTTELFFRQAVGRLVRWTPGTTGQKSFLFIPDEPRLRARAFAIAEQRRHCLRREDPRLVTEGGAELDELESEQASLFAPISAVPLDAGEVPDWELDERGVPEPAYDAALTIPLPPLPPAGRTAAGRLPEGRTLREHKSWLREANTNKVRAIARQTGLTHAAVNNELNRITGLRKISEATVDDLERRLARAEKWLEQESSRHVAG